MDSKLWCSKDGAIVTYGLKVAFMRWGGGAAPGRTHVYPLGGLVHFSMQCVTDDFGNLVEVGK